MIKPLTGIMLCLGLTQAMAQNKPAAPALLAPEKVTQLLPPHVKKQLGINYPVFRVMQFEDKGGLYYCIFTESQNKIADGDTVNRNIRAVTVQQQPDSLMKLWEINDLLVNNSTEEHTIWFFTRFANFRDLDGDGLADPIIVYGTSASNGRSNGRIKFILYHKGKKYAIRHQNGVLDFERFTQVDKTFYSLPVAIQQHVIETMKVFETENLAIFTSDWQKDMRQKKPELGTVIDLK